MKKRNRFRNYLSIEAFVIVLVLLSFRMMDDKKIASVFASLLFIGSTLGILYWETKFADYRKRPSFWGPIVFLVFSALPVFLMRVLNWNMDFNDVQVLGITGGQMHKASSYVFGLMLVCFFIDSYLANVRERQQTEAGETKA